MAWTGDKNNPVPNIGFASGELSQKVQEQSSVLSEKLNDVNRAEQVRRDTDKQKDNTVTLLDTDNAIIKHLESLQLTVVDEGNQIKVPVYYASPEKWKSIQQDGIIRDYNGKMILPAIVFQRMTSESDESMRMFNRHLTYPVIRTYSEKNRYTQFKTLMGQNAPVHEVYNVAMPRHMVFTYHFIIWTEYVEQMNTLVEKFSFATGHSTYWGQLKGLRFRTKLDSFSHTTELQVDQDRMVKTEFDLSVNGYLLPDVINTLESSRNTTQKWFVPKKVVMGVEVVEDSFNLNKTNPNKEKWRNQNYPNIPKNQFIPPVPIGLPIIPKTYINEQGQKVITSIWHLPAPNNSADLGDDGWISYDDDYYYIHTVGFWKRAPQTLVNAISTVAGEKKWTSYDNDYIYISGDLTRIPMSLFNRF